MPDKIGRTAMFYAVLYNQEEILEYFIEKKANCNVMLVEFFYRCTQNALFILLLCYTLKPMIHLHLNFFDSLKIN